MRRRAYANRKDSNHSALVQLHRRLGGLWQDAPPLDGWAACAGSSWVPVEIKSGEHRREGARDEFTKQETDFIKECERTGASFAIWRSEDQVLAWHERQRLRGWT